MKHKNNVLLSRDQFREGVFERDNHTCKFCNRSNVKLDAHHIMERRLFKAEHEKGGYFLNNGISVCEPCHMDCEATIFSVEDCLEAIGLQFQDRATPEHLYPDQVYTKWGDPVNEDGSRAMGELFEDHSVQKVLRDSTMIRLYNTRVKYPRTKHLPWSPGVNDDDKVIPSASIFEGRRVIVTEKMDGENTTMYHDYLHARSITNRKHASRDWVKGFWNQIAWEIPVGFRICGENLYAKHSIGYDNLETYFMGFSVWDGMTCLSWDETLEYFALLGITPVPVLYDGVYDEAKIKAITVDTETSEGYVIRVADSFHYGDFHVSVAKFVREGHVQTVKHHWMSQPVVPNSLKES